MKYVAFLIFLLGMLTACNSNSPTPLPDSGTTIVAQEVVDKFISNGLEVTDVKSPERKPDSPLPNSYIDRLEFSIAEVAPKGGQIFICDTKRNCDAIYAYYDALKALAGPYLYQSPNGRIVAQINKGLTPEIATRFEQIINEYD